ncbi:MAG: translocation/assembly module TamB domain-containing protein [Candidatus Elarobacter sp.]
MFGVRASRRAVIVAAVGAVLLVLLVGFRHAIVRVVLQTVLSSATGYSIRIGDQRLGTSHAVLFDVHVVKNGDPVLDAQRIDVEYALRDIFPGGQHRFGFAAIAIQQPVLTITRHADGTLTFNRPGGSPATPPLATKNAAAPYYFTARVRDGVIRLIDAAPLQPDLANQTIENVSIDASVRSDARTTARLDGVLLGRRTQGGTVSRYPLSVRSLIDVPRGIALTAVRARQLPLRGALGFLIHSRAVRFDDGVLDDVGLQYYALAPKAGQDFAYTFGGRVVLDGGQIAVAALARPVRDLHGAIAIAGDMLSSSALGGTLAGVPLRGRGAIYDLFGAPAMRLALAGDGDLHALRSLFGFSAKLPLSGAAHLETLLTSALAKPLIRTHFSAPHVTYAKFPIETVDGIADYFDGAVTLDGVRARYGSAAVDLGGRVLFTTDGNDMAFVLGARAPGRSLPYANVIAPDSDVLATALIAQPPVPHAGFSARGTLVATGGTSGIGTFAVDPRGVGEFGPFDFGRADGSSLAGAFELERPISTSAGWLHVRNFRLAAVEAAAALPGARLPTFPPLAGIVDGDIAGGGTPDSFGIAGRVHGRDLRAAKFALGSGSFTLDGNLADLRLGEIALAGPLGRFSGNGAYANGVFALDGRYDGTLQQLRPFTGDATARGEVHGPVRATLAQNRIFVQTTGAELAGAQVRGVDDLRRVAGTVEVDGSVVRVIAADATIGGSRAVATDAGGPFFVSAPDLPVSALRGTGLPLTAGVVALYGLADLRGHQPKFDGTVSVADGIASGYPVSGAADLALADSTATIRSGVGALGATYGDFTGRIDGVGSHLLSYDLNANVPVGDVGEMRRTFRLPLRTLEGSFSAALRVRGSGARPDVAGNVVVPEGSYNGLAFSDARAQVDLTPQSLQASNGVITVGSTHAQVDAGVSVAGGAFNLALHSAAADLADFDDYFDEAETLVGTGRVAIAFANDGRTTRTSGRVDVQDFRYRRFAFGTTDATWSQRGGVVSAALNVGGAHGTLRANGTAVPAAGDAVDAFRHATYRANVQTQRIDLATWLPAFGFNLPILGQVNANASLAGRWPRLAVGGDATLLNGSAYGYAVHQGTVHARSDGTRVALTGGILDLGFARFDAGGSFGFDAREPLALTIHGQTPDIAKALAAADPKGPHLDIAGALQADARITGTFAKPRVTAGFDVSNGRYASLAIARILGSATYDGTTLTVNDAEATFAKGNVLVAGSLPLRLQPFGVRSDAPLSFTLGLSGLDLAPFAPLIPGTKTKLGGTVDGRVAIEGTAHAPRVIGQIALAGGSYVSDFDRAGVTKADAKLTFQGTSVALEALHANLGSGTLDGSGRFDLPFALPHASGYTVALIAHGARVDSAQFGRGTIDGTLQVRSAAPLPVVSGDLTLSNASIPFATIVRGSGAAKAPAGATGAPPLDLAFDLMARAGKNVRVQSSVVDIGASGVLDLTGTLSSPKLAGILTASPGGYFSTYNRAFRVQQATVQFDPAQGVIPYVDLRAYAHVTNPDPDLTRNAVGSADITVLVQGQADEIASGAQPLRFASNSPYSQEQIVGLLLDASVFGAINFGQQQNGTILRGAPGESNPLLPPGVTPYQAGIINFNQEAFSILNGQLTQRFLAPIEQALTGRFGLTDFELTVDYGGGVGYNALKQLGHRDVYASFGQTLSAPQRTTLGFTSRPDASTSVQFNYFQQNGNPAITNNANGTQNASITQRLQGIQPLSGRQGFTFLIVRKYP